MCYSFSQNFYFHLFDTDFVDLVLHSRKRKELAVLLCHLFTAWDRQHKESELCCLQQAVSSIISVISAQIRLFLFSSFNLFSYVCIWIFISK